MGNESAIIIPIPEIESAVGALRLKYDPAALLGVPAHITILYPFHQPTAALAEISILTSICASIAGFSFSFTEVRRFPGTVYLHPDKAEAFAKITKTLVKTWPNCEPYGGIHPNIVPHLTVADHVDINISSTVEDSLRDQLPIQCFAREVWLLTSDHTGLWTKKALFPLAVH